MLNVSQHVDVDAIKELKVIMGDEFLSLVATFVSDSRQRVEVLSAAVRSGEPDAIKCAAHSLKGSAGNMAATALAELCRNLEEASMLGDITVCHQLAQQINIEYQQVKTVLETL
ncbi:MAG: Hpt domain-containing protein [Spongiibacteraceae bacterium]